MRHEHLRHLAMFVAELLASVHGQSSGTDAVADSLGPVLASVAMFTVQFGHVLTARHGIKLLVAQR